MLIRMFRTASATGHVFLVGGGRFNDKGLAYSGLIGPRTTVAVVPTTPQILNFAIEAKTKDKQDVEVSGAVTVTLNPKVAVTRLDFTVDAKRGGYVGDWSNVLNAKVTERVLRAVLAKVKEYTVAEATSAQKSVEDAVTAALGSNAFAEDGVTINSCSIPKIEPTDEDIGEAIGSKERQEMLVQSDAALHDRRLKAAANERAVKQYEVDTRLELERKTATLLEEQGKNRQKEAEIDAKATATRLEPLQALEPGMLLGAALMEGFKGGRVGSIVVGPELLGALNQKK